MSEPEEGPLAEDPRPGAVYWIDHYVVGTNNLDRWAAFHERVLGARTVRPDLPNQEHLDLSLTRIVFQELANCRHGGFLQPVALPPSAGPGKGLPRYGFFIRPEDVDEHLRRLDACEAAHTDPVRTSADGEEGTAIYWEDPDGNQFEFWAPTSRVPAGAMDDCGPLRIGRISHGVFESRDLQRTAHFFSRYCALEPLESADIGADTLVLPLAAGGRLVFKRTALPGLRTAGRGVLRRLHTALVVPTEHFWPSYERIWADLPEWGFIAARDGTFTGDWEGLPPRTALEQSPAASNWHAVSGRGAHWYDPDTNLFHFVGGGPLQGSMAKYWRLSIGDYAEEYLAAYGAPPGAESV